MDSKLHQFFYQIRNNITHRGKGGVHRNIELLSFGIEVLSKTLDETIRQLKEHSKIENEVFS